MQDDLCEEEVDLGSGRGRGALEFPLVKRSINS